MIAELHAMRAQHAKRVMDLPGPRGYAMAVNGRVVRQVEWPRTPMRPGDRIEIIRAMPGG